MTGTEPESGSEKRRPGNAPSPREGRKKAPHCGTISIISPISQFRAVQIFTSESVDTFSLRPIFAISAELTPAACCKSFFFISKSIRSFQSFLYEIISKCTHKNSFTSISVDELNSQYLSEFYRFPQIRLGCLVPMLNRCTNGSILLFCLAFCDNMGIPLRRLRRYPLMVDVHT